MKRLSEMDRGKVNEEKNLLDQYYEYTHTNECFKVTYMLECITCCALFGTSEFLFGGRGGSNGRGMDEAFCNVRVRPSSPSLFSTT